jgi:predicted RNA-binding Zn ribbon-like protein
MRLDGGHPALELVNTIYGQVGGPVEHDVLTTPADLATLAARLGLSDAGESAPAAVAAARELRDALDPVLRAVLADTSPPPAALAIVERAARDAIAAADLTPGEGWTWAASDPMTPVHRLAQAATQLLTDPEALAHLRCCDGCCWLFLDHSRGASRRWCSMADCGTEAKKRRYVARRRARRTSTAAA